MSRLWRRGAMAAPVAVAALAFASAASAQTVVTYQPTTTAQFDADINAANAQPAGTLSILQLCGCEYVPAQSEVLTGNIEITGPPSYQADGVGNPDVRVDGSTVQTIAPAVPLFRIMPSANVLMKGFDITGAGSTNINGIIDSGNLEIDNMALDGMTGNAVQVNQPPAHVTVTNSDISDGVFGAFSLQNTGVSQATLNNDTIYDNQTGAFLGGTYTVNNTVFALNNQTSGTECLQPGTTVNAHNSYSDDSSCGTSGITVDPNTQNDFNFTNDNGGPSYTTQPVAGSSFLGQGNVLTCPTSDQRFFLRSSGSCDVGSYQTTGAQDTQTGGPKCTVASVNQTSNPQTMTVNATDSGIGVGTDAILTTTTNNGTVSYPTVGSSWFALTSPGLPNGAPQDQPSTGPLAVTATKPVGDTAKGDTKWSFDAENWLGQITHCN